MSDKPWFVRTNVGIFVNLRPYSAPGWILVVGYMAFAIGMGLVAEWKQLQGMPLVIWGICFGLVTIAFLILAFRNSAKGEIHLVRPNGKGRRK